MAEPKQERQHQDLSPSKELRALLSDQGSAVQLHLDEDAHQDQAGILLAWLRQTGGYTLEGKR